MLVCFATWCWRAPSERVPLGGRAQAMDVNGDDEKYKQMQSANKVALSAEIDGGHWVVFPGHANGSGPHPPYYYNATKGRTLH